MQSRQGKAVLDEYAGTGCRGLMNQDVRGAEETAARHWLFNYHHFLLTSLLSGYCDPHGPRALCLQRLRSS